ncbi:hypothetical protein IGI04_018679 [Brassica rapa subsp. trilocularis]|uniref:Uncharacterized protein n=1 Tax=Brassica rapa subsp. trilocularis TaxID=1813537 RepID=A0ABQ7MG43_BRACM|nr:hypothetical protein IGI04_018679 [Brassica rapa subsp. trilocularis]
MCRSPSTDLPGSWTRLRVAILSNSLTKPRFYHHTVLKYLLAMSSHQFIPSIPKHVFPLDHADQTVHTIPPDHPDRTAHAVHRIDPQTSVSELSLEPRPRDRIDRPMSLLSQPIQHSKTDSQARINLGGEESKDVHIFSLGALLVSTACPEGCPDVLASGPSSGIKATYSDYLYLLTFCVENFQVKMFGLLKRSSNEYSQHQAISRSSCQNSLNVFDEFVTVHERLTIRRPHKMPNRRCKEQFKSSKGEADQKRRFFQFDVQEFCDNFENEMMNVLKEVSKIHKKSTFTRAPVAEPSIFISETSKCKSENNLEDLKDFSDSIPIFDEYDEKLMERLMICEDNCDIPFPEPDFMFDKEHIAELTFLQPEHPSSLVLFSQDFEEKPFDYPHQGPLLGTRRAMDVDLYPIFDEEDDHLDELGATFDEKALSITPIIMENRLCFDPSTTPTPLSKEHCKELCIISSVHDMFDKVSSNERKRSGLDHLEKSIELDLRQLVFCSRKLFDSFVFK